MRIYIPLAKEFRLLPLQVELIRKYIPGDNQIVVVESTPGKDFTFSGGPWVLRRDVAKDLGVTILPSLPNHGLPFQRINRVFSWLKDQVIPNQNEDRALVLSGDMLPVKELDVDALFPASTRMWFAFCWFAMAKTADRNCRTWKWMINVTKREDTMEDVEPGFLHADKLCSHGDFMASKIPILEGMFGVKLPSHEDVRLTLALDAAPIYHQTLKMAPPTPVPPKPVPDMPQHEIRRLMHDKEFLARLPEDLRARFKGVEAGCGCSFMERVKPLLPELTTYLPKRLSAQEI